MGARSASRWTPTALLVVCDADRGLLRIDPATGTVTELVGASELIDGRPLRVCNNAAIARDGTIWFSDSSARFALKHWKGDLLEHSGTGRLLRRDPDGRVEVMLTGLHFANGVALAADESFVAVAETGAYRLTRLWLSGPDAGRSDVLVDNLPGFPDNIARGSDGLIWIAIGSPRNATLDLLAPRPPVLRKMLWALPEALLPKPADTVWVQAVDAARPAGPRSADQHARFLDGHRGARTRRRRLAGQPSFHRDRNLHRAATRFRLRDVTDRSRWMLSSVPV